MSHKSYRIKTEINGGDKVIKVPLKRGIKTFNILSLEINQEDTYQLHTSDYGVIVGRVLANDAFGVPNVKVSVFVPISNEDEENSVISAEYPFKTAQSKDANGARYNLLSDDDNSHLEGKNKRIGTFPNKSFVLDNDGEVEVFDKYWKYTTTTNDAGDYMIFGVPTGSCQVHYDCDLSDIGVISQKPYDLINKGYDANLFKSPSEFLYDDINSAVHILSRDKTIYVYPFWGDADRNKIGITRNDINLDYKFEPSCIFMGGSITDSQGNYIGTYGMPNGNCGRFAALTTSSGNIEIIRRTQEGCIEEVKENVTGIIDGAGVWCYAIPMNLDRIGTDEEGNIVAVNDPNKGIPTRARVRFRFTLTDAMDGSSNEYTAKILVPNNPKLMNGTSYPTLDTNRTSKSDWENFYEFGTKTPDSCFRDLYWGKVYSVKQYYPRFQYGLNREDVPLEKTPGVDYRNYPRPNSAPFSCISSIDSINGFNAFPYNTMYAGAENRSDTDSHNWIYYHLSNIAGNGGMVDKGLLFCFENDWVNGCLYFPRVKISYSKTDAVSSGGYGYKGFDYFGVLNDNGEQYKKIFIGGRHSISYDGTRFKPKHDYIDRFGVGNDLRATKTAYRSQKFAPFGLLTLKETSFGDKVFYYRSAGGLSNDSFYKLYSTDIILLGNVADVYDSLPKLYKNLPSTSTIFPPVVPPREFNESGMNMNGYTNQLDIMYNVGGHDTDEVDMFGNGIHTVKNGKKQDWEDMSAYENGCYENASSDGKSYKNEHYWSCNFHEKDGKPYYYTHEMVRILEERNTLFFACQIRKVHDSIIYITPTFINTSRICELDVGNDHAFTGYKYGNRDRIAINGVIDRFDIIEDENRSAFASMNYDIEKYVIDPITHYRKYIPTPMNLVDFDGRMNVYFTSKKFSRFDEKLDPNYKKFRYGPYNWPTNYLGGNETDKETKLSAWSDALLLTENSLYFYFGLYGGQSAIDAFNKKYGKYEDGKITEDALSVTVESYGCLSDKVNVTVHVYVNNNIRMPFDLYIFKDNELVAKRHIDLLSTENNYVPFNLYDYGLYQVKCYDANNNEYSKSFYVANQGIDIKYSVYSSGKYIEINSVNGIEAINGMANPVPDKVTFFCNGNSCEVTFDSNVERVGKKKIYFKEDAIHVIGTIKMTSLPCYTRDFSFIFGDVDENFCNVPFDVLYPFNHAVSDKREWDSMNTANAGLNKLYSFKDKYSKVKQLSYVSNMINAVFNGGTMSINSDNPEYIPISISPNVDILNMSDLGEAWKGEVTKNCQVCNLNGSVISTNSLPYIVGQNYPIAIASNSGLKTAKDGSYEYNKTLSRKSGTTQSFVNTNYFGLRHVSERVNDKPGPMNIDIDTERNMVGDWPEIKNMFEVKTVDKRLDYQFVVKTPLLLPSGYSDVSSLDNGKLDVTFFGGLRFNHDENGKLTTYSYTSNNVITGSPTSGAELYMRQVYEDNNLPEKLIFTGKGINYEKENVWSTTKNDEIKYSSTELCGKTALHFTIADCSPYFTPSSSEDESYVMQNNIMQLNISYESPIEFNHSNSELYGNTDYDVVYNLNSEDVDSGIAEYRASIEGGKFNFRIKSDSLYAGNVYTDITASIDKNTELNIYPDWANKYDSDYGKKNKEISILRFNESSIKVAEYDLKNYTDKNSYPNLNALSGNCHFMSYTDEDQTVLLNDNDTYSFCRLGLAKDNISDVFGEYDYLMIPTKRVYNETAPSLLKQGVVYNSGYAYYASKIFVKKRLDSTNTVRFEVYLYSPFKNDASEDEVKITTSLINSKGRKHTVGNINSYRVETFSLDANVNYDSSKLKFTISGISRELECDLYFTMENGLRYKIHFKPYGN